VNEPEKKRAGSPKGAFREIITKAVCGTAKKTCRYTQLLDLPGDIVASNVLGTSVTQVRLKEPEVTEARAQNLMSVRVEGQFDLHVWYAHSYGRSTDVIKQTVPFEEILPLQDFDGHSLSLVDARAMITRVPQCTNAMVEKSGGVKIDFELALYAEVIGETKVWVRVYPPEQDDEES
jgi:spore coat protein E